MSLTTEQLMKPRYKVIALWPLCTVHSDKTDDRPSVGDIIIESLAGFDGPKDFKIKHPEKYPHLFRKLHWWHERNPDDLPKFIGCKNESGKFIWVAPVVKWNETRLNESGSVTISYTDLDGNYAEREYGPLDLTPATLSDYNEYLNRALHP